MDRTDEEILAELKENGKITVKEIAKKLNSPMSTIHHRIKQMEKEKTIKRYSVELDHKKIGLTLSAFIFISVDYNKIKSQEEVAKEIKKLGNVDEVNIVTGDIDIIAKIRAHDIDELNDILIHRLRAIRGVDKTRTSVVLNEFG